MKMIMKDKKANNLIIGAIYINGVTSAPCRLVGIVSCQGVYLETYDGQGFDNLVKFEDVFYADMDEVEDYLADSRVYDASNKSPSHKSFMDGEPCSYSANTLERVTWISDRD